jgi:hypothetical protein
LPFGFSLPSTKPVRSRPSRYLKPWTRRSRRHGRRGAREAGAPGPGSGHGASRRRARRGERSERRELYGNEGDTTTRPSEPANRPTRRRPSAIRPSGHRNGHARYDLRSKPSRLWSEPRQATLRRQQNNGENGLDDARGFGGPMVAL